MSRINAGAVVPALRSVSLDEVVPAAIASLGPRARDVTADIPETCPLVDADPALLERVVANLVDNALTHGHSDCPVRVEAGATAGRVPYAPSTEARAFPSSFESRSSPLPAT